MKKIAKFLSFRKQHDSVKCAILLLLCAAYFVGSSVLCTAQYWGKVHKPVEYVFELDSPADSIESKLAEIKKIDGFVAMSPQISDSISYKNKDNETTLSVTKLSKQYLSKAYGILPEKTQNSLYFNKVAFEEISTDSKSSSIKMTYYTKCVLNNEGKQGKENNQDQSGVKPASTGSSIQKKAEFIKLDSINSEEKVGVTAASSADLSKSTTMRVMFSGTDITGSQIDSLQQLGFIIFNQDIVLTQSYELQIILQKLKYNTIIAVLSVIFACFLIKRACYSNKTIST